MKKLLLLLFLLSPLPLFATHIVGGELTLSHLNDDRYRLQLNLYFDAVNGNSDAVDPSIIVGVFNKSNDLLVGQFVLPYRSVSYVPYTKEECAVGELSTRLYVFSSIVELPEAVYDEPQGYYLIWERCCRNDDIVNIIDPGGSGQTFYLEIPPVVKDGQPLINSSPILFPPLSDYACLGHPFNFDFSGTDPDGDSLVYSITPPLKGNSLPVPNSMIVPPSLPGPYATVNWGGGYSDQVQIQGTPPLAIDSLTGLLQFTPTTLGLHVFAVKCEEYRNGVKLGEVHREFQLLVRQCFPNAAPQSMVLLPGTQEIYQEGEVITINPGDDRCLTLVGIDLDTTQNLSAWARSVNFNSPVTLTVTGGGPVNYPGQPGDSVYMEICFDSCIASSDVPLLIDLIVQDDGCARPLLDTTRITLNIPPLPNEPPAIRSVTWVPGDTVSIGISEQVRYQVISGDPERKMAILRAYGEEFRLNDVGMNFRVTAVGDSLEGTLQWQPTCSPEILGVHQVNFVCTDGDCINPKSDTTTVWIEVLPEDNEPPLVRKLLEGDSIVMEVGETLSFNVEGQDTEGRRVVLNADGLGFQLQNAGMQFSSNPGTTEATGTFRWTSTCEAITAGWMQVQFIARDEHCLYPGADTTSAWLKVENDDPIAIIYSDLDTTVTSIPMLEVLAGKDTTFNLFCEDIDTSLMVLEAHGVGFDLAEFGMSFTSQQGTRFLTSPFQWKTDCSYLPQSPFRVVFTLGEQGCPEYRRDSVVVDLVVIDSADRDLINPPNVFTPNGDDKNEVFVLTDLPPDNCNDQFLAVRIYNRWGKEVYQNDTRDFAWTGDGLPIGIYYYVVEYRRRKVKGWVQIMR
ncbi:gliding motility-associated C-terminal domain-containing protein [Catalinimonas alkaloidigena]|uniref:Gliding motility-associated C-terminal domain-containing protein n=1 Tax=Catalinimonas alkaloidigena TaxID=1075417 RepID=A0A1G9NBU4_9BACT|nr:gliding motility-associated C-terminal domain-containing protein [Catalinimonas alkaloidigena]SDL83843.1 gliding motility-associated C-terminal domain-containing protein [Catalinimonas alkaloidigena]